MAIGKQKSDLPCWLPRWITAEDVKTVALAVSEAEKKTSGEIVPMIVRSSGYYGHVRPLLTVILFVLASILELEFLFDKFSFLPAWLVLPLLLILCYGVAFPLSRLPWLCRAMTLNQDEIRAVHARAELEFYRGYLNKTTRSTTILIFVSWLEKRAVVLADKSIAEKISNTVWQDLVQTLLQGFGEKQFAKGWQLTLQKSGEVLSQHFPAQGPATNELSDQLIIKD